MQEIPDVERTAGDFHASTLKIRVKIKKRRQEAALFQQNHLPHRLIFASLDHIEIRHDADLTSPLIATVPNH
ncbi:MAG: hypothetical protein B6244_04545 [Candidatus Cloacimonetes bacterium 4572_55]|nr:MAG: hypothetical protein B6244_04545 [Candidatus Cloacimonetes bacterium 4572_55]